VKRITRTMNAVLLIALLLPALAAAVDLKRIVVFGASLSDSGNAYALTGQTIKRPYSELDEFLIPPAPYKIGDNRFSNGPVWIERLAARLGQSASAEPAFADSGPTATNCAVGGARAREDGVHLNFAVQVASFLEDVRFAAPADALYVIDLGANDVRDALAAGNAAEIQSVLSDALESIAAQIGILYAAGARDFLVLNVPDLGVLPSIRILDERYLPGATAFAGTLSALFNENLENVLASLEAFPGIRIARLNVHEKVNALIAQPARFGLAETALPCVSPEAAPFTCNKPDRYLFWDGVHPTRQVHEIFAGAAEEVLGAASFAAAAK